MPVRYFYTGVVILVGWVFFRAETVSYAIGYLKVMSGFSINHSFPAILSLNAKTILALALGLIGSTPFIGNALNSHNRNMSDNDRSWVKLNVLAQSMIKTFYLLLFLICVIFLSGDTYNPFIYFRF